MIRNMVFDMGNVCLVFDPDLHISPYVDNEEDHRAIHKALYESKEWIQADAGEISADEVVSRVRTSLPERLWGTLERVYDNWPKHWVEIPEMTALIDEIHRAGYRVYLLSNASTRFRSYYKSFPVFNAFDDFFISAEEKCLKPNADIYEKFCKKFSLQPEECFFVDDLAENIQGAKDYGMDGYVFDDLDAKSLRACLVEKGILKK